MHCFELRGTFHKHRIKNPNDNLCILKIESPTTKGRVDCLKKRLWGDTHYLLKLDTAAVNGTEWERLVNFVTCLLSAAFIFLPFISSIYIYQRRSQWPLCAGVNAHALCLSLAKAGLLLQRCNHQGVLPWTFEDSKTYESSQTEHKTSRNVKQDAT